MMAISVSSTNTGRPVYARVSIEFFRISASVSEIKFRVSPVFKNDLDTSYDGGFSESRV